jgi:KUP system potassium uptake protein
MMTEKKISTPLILGSLGVVFGDIGTSPLYALRETLSDLPINLMQILGILSLIFWTLIISISLKYLVLIFRADNDGEGGALALLALLKRKEAKNVHVFYIIAIFATGMMLGDAMLTPAISVISAIEGVELYYTGLSPHITSIACIILIALFFFQHKGTAKIGATFGPCLLIWFIIIGFLGFIHIAANPIVLKAINPFYAIHFFQINGMKGYWLLGGVFLVVTGGEALYADIGHFGKNPIRISWYFIALPALLLNYFGQGSYLLLHPEGTSNPFYSLAPDWFFIPLLIISTVAAVIASQAVISATFSLIKQAVFLGLSPRFPIIQTSQKLVGQIYIPQINFFLMLGTLILLFSFQNSSRLAHAYGIAVNSVMLMVLTIVAYVAWTVWKWSRIKTVAVFGFFCLVDLAFLGANAHKILTGGWLPILFALIVATVMYTWNNGLLYLKEHFYLQEEELPKLIKQLHYKSLQQLPGRTAIFITDIYDRSGGSFLHFLKMSNTVPENILIVNYEVANRPRILTKNRFHIKALGNKIYQLTLRYGFIETISVPHELQLLNELGKIPFKINISSATFFVDMPNILALKEKKSLRFYWQEKLFAFLIRNYTMNLNIDFYRLPYNRTIALGTYYVI